jgi:hypothetical protein
MDEVLAREVLLLAGTLLRWAQEVWAAVVAGCAAGVVVVAEGRRAEAEWVLGKSSGVVVWMSWRRPVAGEEVPWFRAGDAGTRGLEPGGPTTITFPFF